MLEPVIQKEKLFPLNPSTGRQQPPSFTITIGQTHRIDTV